MERDPEHLKVVVGGDGNAEREKPAEQPRRAPSRLRAKKALPTDRLKFETQTAALRAFVSATNRGEDTASAEDVGARINVSPDTAGLTNAFFVDAGFLTKEGRGLYRPVPAVNEYARLNTLNEIEASKQLAEPLRNSWYFTEVGRELESAGKVSEDVLINVLGRAAGAGGDRRAQLELVLEWLAYARLILREEGVARLAWGVDASDQGDPESEAGATNGEDEQPDPAKSKGTTKNKPGETPESPQVLGFAFEFSLTADDLRKLTPEQIAALFEAVGKAMAIKGAAAE